MAQTTPQNHTSPQFLLSTASLYLSSLEQSFSLARETGFDGLELSLAPASARSTPQQIASLAQKMGLTIPSLHPPAIPLPGWPDTPATWRRLAQWAPLLPGCTIVVLHAPDGVDEPDPPMQRFRDTLRLLQRELAGSDIRVALENGNHRPGDPLGSLDRPRDLLAFSQQHDCQIVLDTAHMHTTPFPLLEAYHTLRPRLGNVHLSDVRPIGRWSRFSYIRSIFSHHQPPGQGVLPLQHLLQKMRQDHYQGLITLELSPVALRFWRPSATRRILRHALRTCRRWFEDPAASTSPSRIVDNSIGV